MSQLPNFFILGAPKSGTTALYHWLGKHPSVHLSTPKEPYFFEDEYDRGHEFYWRTYFAAGWRGQSLVGDARAAHLYLPYVPQRIHATVPEARLVAILRNPVERAYAHWWMQHSRGRDPLGFDEALRRNRQALADGDSYEGEHAEHLWRAHIAPDRDDRGIRPVTARPYIEAGHYADHIGRYLRFFPRERLCILLHDDFLRGPLETMRQVYQLLGLDPGDIRGAPARENVGLTNFSRPLFALSERWRLERVLPRRVLAALRNGLSRIGTRPAMSEEARDWLRRHYAPYNRRLEGLLGRDLESWDR
jgi:hypothetical protein